MKRVRSGPWNEDPMIWPRDRKTGGQELTTEVLYSNATSCLSGLKPTDKEKGFQF